MTIKYYFRTDSTGATKAYIEGLDTDSLWNPDVCIEVTKRPDYRYIYDFDNSEWIINEASWMNDLRSKRNDELARTDKFVLTDYPISEENLAIAITYRQELRDCTAAPEIINRVLPECPECCNK